MNVLDLFSGIGGFSLGLKRAGMRTVAFCEIDPYCRRVLAKHWPDVPVYGDIRELTAAQIMADAESRRCGEGRTRRSAGVVSGLREQAPSAAIDLICGGFPCTDISVAGKGLGITGPQSGLWSEYARIIGEVRPRYVIVENVAALLGRGLERVLGDLAALGFDAEWHCIPASAVGAPHRRDRLWIIAHTECHELRHEPRRWNGACGTGAAVVGDDGAQGFVADADAGRQPQHAQRDSKQWERLDGALRHHLERYRLDGSQWDEERWFAQSGMGRVAHGVPARVDRLRSLGNAIVPQIPEIIGRAIMSVECDDYDGDDDFAKSYSECLRAIRERKANGGKGWGGWE
jgi:DNA (cytosine-5)-methyltransferase 1